MELDEMKALWAQHDTKIDTAIRLNRQILTGMQLNRAKSAMHRLIAGLTVQAGMDLLAPMALGTFLYDHWKTLRFAVPGVMVDVFAIFVLSSTIRQIAMACQIDYTASVSGIQRQIEQLRVLRIRTIQGILIGSPLLWTPLVIVALEGLFRIDAYVTLGIPWLLANLLFGVLFAAGAVWVARRFATQLGHLPVVQRLARDLAGHSVTSAARFVATIDDLAGAER